MDNCYKLIDIESGVNYKPVRKKSGSSSYYDKYPICKFLCAEAPSGDVKVWAAGVDCENEDSAIVIPGTAFVAGNEYNISVGKMEFTGGKFIGYMSLMIPLDFPEKNV